MEGNLKSSFDKLSIDNKFILSFDILLINFIAQNLALMKNEVFSFTQWLFCSHCDVAMRAMCEYIWHCCCMFAFVLLGLRVGNTSLYMTYVVHIRPMVDGHNIMKAVVINRFLFKIQTPLLFTTGTCNCYPFWILLIQTIAMYHKNVNQTKASNVGFHMRKAWQSMKICLTKLCETVHVEIWY